MAFYGLFAIFPGIAAIIALFGLFADPAVVDTQLDLMSGLMPPGVFALFRGQIDAVLGAETGALGQFVRNHPKGLDLEISDGGEGLSIGQRQSIGWARLWLQDPAICLLDEPTAALDQTLEATLVSRLQTWLVGRTAIIATHRVPILELTSRTVILQNGRLAVDGPRQDVLAHLQKTKVTA